MTEELTITDLHVEMHEGPISVDGWYGESTAVSIHDPRALFEGSDGIIRVGLFATEDDTPVVDESHESSTTETTDKGVGREDEDDFPSAEETSVNVSLTKEQARVWGERLIEAAGMDTQPSLDGQGFVDRDGEE